MPSAPFTPSRTSFVAATGFIAGMIFVLSGVTALVSSLASVTYFMYLIIIHASLIEMLSTMVYLALAFVAIALLMVISVKVRVACLGNKHGWTVPVTT